MSYYPLPVNLAAECRAADLRKVRLGRYPFRAGIKYYVARKEMQLSDSTIHEDERKLRYFAGILESLAAKKLIKTTDPRHLSSCDVIEWILYVRNATRISRATEGKYRQIMDRYLTTWGNDAISKVKREMPHTTAPAKAPVRALSVEQHKTLLEAAEAATGPNAWALRGFFYIAMGTGCRPGEIFRARREDLDLSRMRFYVREPKGNGKWAEPIWVDILRPELLLSLRNFLRERDAAVGKCPHLFCNGHTGKPFTSNAFRRWKSRLSKETGVEFQLKDLRSSFASLMVAGDLSRMKAVSLQMRHNSVDTTEKYYLRINREEEIKRALGDVWKDSPIQ